MNIRGFSSWEALIFILLSSVLLATLAGFSIMEFSTANQLYGTIWAGRLLDDIEFRDLPPNIERETTITVPRGLHDPELVKKGNSWKLTITFDGQTLSREFSIKPVFDPVNLLEIPGRHRVIVWKEGESVLIKKL